MANRTNAPEYYESGVSGPNPSDWFGTDAIDGDAGDFARSAPGFSYIQRDLTNNLASIPRYKVKASGLENDWAGLQCISETVTRAMMTDGGAAIGTYDLRTQIPAGAWGLRCFLQDVTGFTGNVSATIQVGDGTDVDRYTTGTPSVFTTAVAIDLGVLSGTAIHIAAVTPKITITASADFTAVTAGTLTIKLFYLI